MSAVAAYFASGFFVAHLLIAVVSALLLARQSNRIGELKKVSPRQRSEADLRRHMYPLEGFERYFDYCSSAFIFVGLVGTMLGFIQAVPELQNPQYDFHHLRDALAVSAFGIAWSALLLGIVSAQHYYVIAPLTEHLLSTLEANELARILAEQADEFHTRTATALEKGLTDFSAGAHHTASAAESLASAAQSAQASFAEVVGELTRAASTVGEIYANAEKLPQMVTAEMARAFDGHNTRLQEILTAQTASLQAGSEAFREALRADQAQWEVARYASADEGRARLQEFFAELQRGYQEALLKEQESLAQGTADALRGIKRTLKQFDAALNGVAEKLPPEIIRSHDVGIERIDQAVQRLEIIAREQAKSAKLLDRATENANRALDAFGQSVDKLAESLQGSEVNPTSIHHRLDELTKALARSRWFSRKG